MNNQSNKFCNSKANDSTNDKERLWFKYQELKSVLCLKCCKRYIFFFLYICIVGVSVYFLSKTVFCLSKTVISLHNQQQEKQRKLDSRINSEKISMDVECNKNSQDKKRPYSVDISGDIQNSEASVSKLAPNIKSQRYLWLIIILILAILILIFSIPIILSSIDKRFIQLYLDDKELEIKQRN